VFEALEGRQLMAAQLTVTDTVAPNNDRAANLGQTQVGNSSGAQTFSLVNSGDAILHVTNFAKSGAQAAAFAVTVKDNAAQTVVGNTFDVPAGQTFTVDVVFSPSATGVNNAQVDFTTDDPDAGDATVQLALAGEGTAAGTAEITVTDETAPTTDLQLDMPDTPVNTTSAVRRFTLRNDGTAALNITNFLKTGANAAEFGVTVKNNASQTVAGNSFSIAAGLAYTVEVTFTPTAAAERTAEITLTTNDPDDNEGSLSLELRGTGNTAGTGPEITITDNTTPTDDLILAFPDTFRDQTSAPKTFFISNAGTDPLNITTFALAGTNAAEFTPTVKDGSGNTITTTNFTIPAGQAYTVQVVFAPKDEGARTAQITFGTNDPDDNEAAITLTLNGTSTRAPGTPPAAPTGLKATVVSPHSIQLSWKDNADDENGFILYQSSTPDGPFLRKKTVPASSGIDKTVTTTRVNLKPGVPYFFRVASFLREDGGEVKSNGTSANATPPALAPDEAGNSVDAALNVGRLRSAKAFRDYVGFGDKKDNYRFTLPVRSEFEVALTQITDDADIRLYKLDPVKGPVIVGVSENFGSANDRIARRIDAGAYMLQVLYAGESGGTNYRIVMNVDYAGETRGAARDVGRLVGLRAFTESVGRDDAQDFYELSLAGTRNLRLSLTGLTVDADLELLDPAGKRIAIAEQSGDVDEVITRRLARGSYCVRVFTPDSPTANTNYRLVMSVT